MVDPGEGAAAAGQLRRQIAHGMLALAAIALAVNQHMPVRPIGAVVMIDAVAGIPAGKRANGAVKLGIAQPNAQRAVSAVGKPADIVVLPFVGKAGEQTPKRPDQFLADIISPGFAVRHIGEHGFMYRRNNQRNMVFARQVFRARHAQPNGVVACPAVVHPEHLEFFAVKSGLRHHYRNGDFHF
jgi:hypothetical protein